MTTPNTHGAPGSGAHNGEHGPPVALPATFWDNQKWWMIPVLAVLGAFIFAAVMISAARGGKSVGGDPALQFAPEPQQVQATPQQAQQPPRLPRPRPTPPLAVEDANRLIAGVRAPVESEEVVLALTAPGQSVVLAVSDGVAKTSVADGLWTDYWFLDSAGRTLAGGPGPTTRRVAGGQELTYSCPTGTVKVRVAARR